MRVESNAATKTRAALMRSDSLVAPANASRTIGIIRERISLSSPGFNPPCSRASSRLGPPPVRPDLEALSAAKGDRHPAGKPVPARPRAGLHPYRQVTRLRAQTCNMKWGDLREVLPRPRLNFSYFSPLLTTRQDVFARANK